VISVLPFVLCSAPIQQNPVQTSNESRQFEPEKFSQTDFGVQKSDENLLTTRVQPLTTFSSLDSSDNDDGDDIKEGDSDDESQPFKTPNNLLSCQISVITPIQMDTDHSLFLEPSVEFPSSIQPMVFDPLKPPNSLQLQPLKSIQLSNRMVGYERVQIRPNQSKDPKVLFVSQLKMGRCEITEMTF
jgi:hypothetical protein